MKKIVYFFIILFLPVYINAYSKFIIPGGESIGININSDGLIVVGYYKVNNKYIAKDNIQIGDKIIKVNDKRIYTIDELSKIVDKSISDSSDIFIELVRGSKSITTKLTLVLDDGVYKTGLYVKDNVVGLGTISYIDPVSKVYGALGHEVTLSSTSNIVDIRNGSILKSNITGIHRSTNGYVGSKDAKILYNKRIGSIKSNTTSGIFGLYESDLPKKDIMEVGYFNDIKKGNAKILTVLSNNKIESFDINIIDKYNTRRNTQKAFSFEIVDKKLLDKTGGVIQGMSGSPIIQDNKIIGAVTNVIVDDVKYGYGISIITMLEEGEKVL